MLPTPSTSHVNYNQVYEPAEDSYLLLDTLSSSAETRFLRNRFQNNTPTPLVVEIGPGSGVVLAFITAHAQTLFDRSDVATLGIDLNPLACAAASETVKMAVKESASTDQGQLAVFLDTVQGDLATPMKAQSIDVLVFNPPYVPSEDLPLVPQDDEALDAFSHDSRLLALSTDGGIDGMETTNRLLAQLEHALSDGGVAYILLCAQNKPEEVMARVVSWRTSNSGKWAVEEVGSSGKKAGWERLCVLRIWRVNEITSHLAQ